MQVQVKLQAEGVDMRAHARSVSAAGYLSVWQAASAIRTNVDDAAEGDPIDPEEDLSETDMASLTVVEEEKRRFDAIRNWKVQDNVELVKVDSRDHDTEPPGRYSEASLVKQMEHLGIGRPSTYARIIEVLQERY